MLTMTGSVEGPFSPSILLPLGSGSANLNPSHAPIHSVVPLASTPATDHEENDSSDIELEVEVDRISSAMGARLVVAFVELVMYLKGQVPFPPSTLRMMAANGRKGSSQQTKLLKSLHALAEDLPSTLETLDTQQSVSLALAFGFGRAKCFVQLSGADFARPGVQDESINDIERTACLVQLPNQDQNLDPSAQTPKRRLSPRLPLHEITPAPSPPSVETLGSQLASITLKPALSQEATIRKAERALAREITISSLADNASLNPASGQIYLRAPRGFRHPKWVVRHDAAKMLDVPFGAITSGSSREGIAGVEYVRVRAREFVEPQGEDEEMIWWGWEGRLAGYA